MIQFRRLLMELDTAMREQIFNGHGIEGFRDGERFSIRYNAGGVVVNHQEIEVPQAEAEKAMLSEHDAYEALLKATRGSS